METNDQNDNSYWKLGFLYYNPGDSKIIVTKRYGIGWTFNFAHPVSYLLIVGIVLLIFSIKYFIR